MIDFHDGTRVIAECYRLIDNHSTMTVESGIIIGSAGLGYLVEFDDGYQAGVFPSEIYHTEDAP